MFKSKRKLRHEISDLKLGVKKYRELVAMLLEENSELCIERRGLMQGMLAERRKRQGLEGIDKYMKESPDVYHDTGCMVLEINQWET